MPQPVRALARGLKLSLIILARPADARVHEKAVPLLWDPSFRQGQSLRGTHFRNYTTAYETLAKNFLDVDTVELKFFGENHGKGSIDGHFGTLLVAHWGVGPTTYKVLTAAAKQSAQ